MLVAGTPSVLLEDPPPVVMLAVGLYDVMNWPVEL
jgi:hypothetical protein